MKIKKNLIPWLVKKLTINIDGGFSNSVYLVSQLIDGGAA